MAILGYIACSYLFIEPRGRLDLVDAGAVLGLLAYIFTCLLIVAFGEAARRAQRQANERRELLRITLRSIGDAVITTDVEGRVTYMNAVAESLTGFTQPEATGRPLDAVFRSRQRAHASGRSKTPHPERCAKVSSSDWRITRC